MIAMNRSTVWAIQRRAAAVVIALTSGVVPLTCGGHSSNCENCGAPNSDGGGAGGSDTSSEPGVRCPMAEPQEGAPCPGRLDCTYGDSLRPDCRRMFVCQDGSRGETTPTVWSSRPSCRPPPPDFCPINPPASERCVPIADPNERAPCEYPPDVVCSCPCHLSPSAPGCDLNQKWKCYDPPAEPGCPPSVPNLGSSCTQGIRCEYGDPCEGWGMVTFCRGGLWEVGAASCPL